MLPVTLVDGLGNAGEAGQLDGDTEFFFDFAPGGVLGAFAKIDLAAGQTPRSRFGLLETLDKQQAPVRIANGCAATGAGKGVRISHAYQFTGPWRDWQGEIGTVARRIALRFFTIQLAFEALLEMFGMAYTITRTLDGITLEEADKRTRAALSGKGFGVLTEIDVQATMKKKLDADMAGYRILGACNPDMAFEAIKMEPRVGAMLPCNVILREVDGGIEISAIDPVASMQAIENTELHAVAGQVRDMLEEALEAI